MADDEFSDALDQCVRAAVRMQEEIGLAVVTDGEFRRGSYWSRFVERTQGLEVRGALLKFRDEQGHELEFTAPYATGRIKRAGPISLDYLTPHVAAAIERAETGLVVRIDHTLVSLGEGATIDIVARGVHLGRRGGEAQLTLPELAS